MNTAGERLSFNKERLPDTSRASLLAAIVIIFGVLSTTLAQTQLLGRLPLQNLLKNALHADRSANAAYFFWVTLPWYFKPLVGIVSDAFPLFGSRRRSYLILGALLATVAWFAMAAAPHRYRALLGIGLLINTAMVIASTVIGGYMVEAAQSSASSGRLTSVRNFIEQLSYVITGPVAGLLASISFAWTGVACGSIAFLVVPVAFWMMRERYQPAAGIEAFRRAGHQVRLTLRSRDVWLAAAVAALFYFAPGTQTATFYRQQNLLHLNPQGQGFLIFLNGIFGVAAATLYGLFGARRFTLRTLLMVCLGFGAAANLGYLFYTSVPNARVIESFWGFGFTLAEVAMMHLVVRVTPSGSEALGFALLMAVRNLGLFGADWFGSNLMDHHQVPYDVLVLANGITSALAIPLVLILPRAVVAVRDAQGPTPLE